MSKKANSTPSRGSLFAGGKHTGGLPASFGEADKTARPLGISVDDVVRAEVATSQANKVQLLGSGQLDRDWRPSKDAAPTAWEAVHHLADRLD